MKRIMSLLLSMLLLMSLCACNKNSAEDVSEPEIIELTTENISDYLTINSTLEESTVEASYILGHEGWSGESTIKTEIFTQPESPSPPPTAGKFSSALQGWTAQGTGTEATVSACPSPKALSRATAEKSGQRARTTKTAFSSIFPSAGSCFILHKKPPQMRF